MPVAVFASLEPGRERVRMTVLGAPDPADQYDERTQSENHTKGSGVHLQSSPGGISQSGHPCGW